MRDTRDDEPLPPLPPSAQPSGDGAPKFGRLLIVLALAMLLVVALTFGSEAYFT
ncbi:hypothetical protein ABIB42_003049 [Massilia sp. UYP32]|jgi:hypothetical protein|uniref:Uncharacterized protein n=2 Tax=Massilia timonae TaxID=47229 RepID=K9DG83_9BURK|nr:MULTISPECIES: hypothetical protein [Massilia]EKU83248.1 hypothetical protein HMPREF9710_01646 [Massilia timonae CCUG 45783]OIJ43553.1 hypothetical protein LO55_2235 [Massilia timonae]QYF99580.1 hypothetical protein KY496_14160 [Massilia sp. NP310]